MKHLQKFGLFEKVTEESEDRYYQEITRQEFLRLNYSMIEDFKKEEIDKVKEFFSEAKLYFVPPDDDEKNQDKKIIEILVSKNLPQTNFLFTTCILIYKFDDEWFYITKDMSLERHILGARASAYKCDQIDGLMNCLEDNFR